MGIHQGSPDVQQRVLCKEMYDACRGDGRNGPAERVMALPWMWGAMEESGVGTLLPWVAGARDAQKCSTATDLG